MYSIRTKTLLVTCSALVALADSLDAAERLAHGGVGH